MVVRVIALGVAATAAAATWAGIHTARDMQARWGVDPDATASPMPGDDLVAAPDAVDTRVIDIDAPPDAVWPWLVQMGYGRAGWYSYDALDMNEPSALTIEERWQHLAVGDVLPTHPEGGFVVRGLEEPHSLVLYLDRALVEEQEHAGKDGAKATGNVRATGSYLSQTVQGDFAASWAFQLEARPEGGTRLIERFRVRMEAPAKVQPLMGVARGALGFGVFVMTRRQMLGIKDRAEGRFGPAKRSFPVHPGERPDAGTAAAPAPA